MKNIFKIFNNRQTNISNKDIDNVLNIIADKYSSQNPQTELQWHSLRIKIASQDVKQKKYFWETNLKYAVGFCAVLLIGISIIFFINTDKYYETLNGFRSTVMLGDSTEIKLNSLTKLSVSNNMFSNTRKVSLQGEALFKVKKNGHPFFVITELATIEVLGTEFNVKTRDSLLEVAVINGTVKVVSQNNKSVILTKGQITLCTKDNLQAANNIPFENYPGWVNGKHMFYKTELLNVCKELELQYGIKIKIQNMDLLHKTITGIIDANNIDVAIKTLAQLTNAKLVYDNGAYIIY